MSAKVMQRIIGRTPKHEKAVLLGYHRYKIHDELYPAIAPKEGAKVQGMFIKDLTEGEIIAMDAWEDDEYTRLEVEIELQHQEEAGTKRTAMANAYCWSPHSDHMRLHGTWEFEHDFKPIEQNFLDTNCPY